jgi:hypothetical protein
MSAQAHSHPGSSRPSSAPRPTTHQAASASTSDRAKPATARTIRPTPPASRTRSEKRRSEGSRVQPCTGRNFRRARPSTPATARRAPAGTRSSSQKASTCSRAAASSPSPAIRRVTSASGARWSRSSGPSTATVPSRRRPPASTRNCPSGRASTAGPLPATVSSAALVRASTGAPSSPSARAAAAIHRATSAPPPLPRSAGGSGTAATRRPCRRTTAASASPRRAVGHTGISVLIHPPCGSRQSTVDSRRLRS